MIHEIISYKDGAIVVDKTLEIKDEQSYCTYYEDIAKPSQCGHPECHFKIIYATSNLKLQGIKELVIPDEESDDVLMSNIANGQAIGFQKAKVTNEDDLNTLIYLVCRNAINLYKAVQSKGCYSEEDVRKTIYFGINCQKVIDDESYKKRAVQITSFIESLKKFPKQVEVSDTTGEIVKFIY